MHLAGFPLQQIQRLLRPFPAYRLPLAARQARANSLAYARTICSYVYELQPGDIPETIAANLAASARANWTVNLSGTTLAVPGASSLLARVVACSPAEQEARRQRQGFRITCWCPTPAVRDTSASAIDLFLAGFQFIDLADGSQGRLQYCGTLVFDQSEDALLYRRDLLYDVEYPTIVTALQPAMLFGNIIVNAGTFTA